MCDFCEAEPDNKWLIHIIHCTILEPKPHERLNQTSHWNYDHSALYLWFDKQKKKKFANHMCSSGTIGQTKTPPQTHTHSHSFSLSMLHGGRRRKYVLVFSACHAQSSIVSTLKRWWWSWFNLIYTTQTIKE